MRGPTGPLPRSWRLAGAHGGVVATILVLMLPVQASAQAPAQVHAQRDTAKQDSVTVTPLLKAARDSNGGLVLQGNTQLKNGTIVKINGQKWQILMPEPEKSKVPADTTETKGSTPTAATAGVADTTRPGR